VARENVEMVGLNDIITIKLKNIYEGIDESDVDLVSLDLPQPELVVHHAERALKVGGYLSAFTPCVEHLQRLYESLRNSSFRGFKTIECLVREMEVKKTCTRPSTRMIAHTGYLTFARRV
jgi:tRNA (adenine57-N1/adenine58-N1)-methyltransferase